MTQATASGRTTIARSGLQTALSLATVTGLAAVVGVVIARRFGRGAETDGFFAAYGLFIVLVMAANALRLVVLPRLTRARGQGTLGAETIAYTVSLLPVAVPLLAVSALWSDEVGGLLTGSLPPASREAAGTALVWMLPAAVAQLYAGLAASALAALDDYGTAAAGYAAGSVAGLALILLRVDADGIIAVAWGMALNGGVALAVPLAALLARRLRWRGGSAVELRARLGEFALGVSLPLALQALYVICLRAASGLGVGALTSFNYGYLIAAALIATTASSLGLVSAVPLTRLGLGLGGERAGRHVVSTSWLALAVIAGAAGVFALAGDVVVEAGLGSAYGGETGAELGRLVAELSPFIVVSVGVSVTFPLIFVHGGARLLPLVALGALALQVPLALAGRELLGLAGLALALALTTGLVLAALLAMLAPATLGHVARGLGAAALVSGGLAVASFAPAAVLLDAVPAAVLGLLLYGGALAAIRPRGLRDAWAYVRELH